MKSIILNVFTIASLIFGVFSITSKNPVISILFLIATFVAASCYILYLGISFIGISYLIVYVGAIAVLFLFIIMMINIKLTDIIETGAQYTKTLPLGLLIVLLFIFIFFYTIPNIFINSYFDYISYGDIITNNSFYIESSLMDNKLLNLLHIDSVGLALYVYGVILLLICSIILLLAMFSAIIISSNSENKNSY